MCELYLVIIKLRLRLITVIKIFLIVLYLPIQMNILYYKNLNQNVYMGYIASTSISTILIFIFKIT